MDNKLTAFTMAIPVAFLQSMSVFTAQNVGAKQPARIKKGLRYMSFTAIGAGVLLSLLCYFGGSTMASVFTSDVQSRLTPLPCLQAAARKTNSIVLRVAAFLFPAGPTSIATSHFLCACGFSIAICAKEVYNGEGFSAGTL